MHYVTLIFFSFRKPISKSILSIPNTPSDRELNSLSNSVFVVLQWTMGSQKSVPISEVTDALCHIDFFSFWKPISKSILYIPNAPSDRELNSLSNGVFVFVFQ